MYVLNDYLFVASNLSLKGRGICVFAKPNLKFISLDCLIVFSEYIFCKFIISSEHLYLGVIYRSPSSTYDNNQELCNLLTYMSNVNNDNLVIVGDFNYNSIDWNLKIVNSTSVSE